MRKMMLATIALAALALAACNSHKGRAVRTFELHRLTPQEVDALLTPYINEGGYFTVRNRLLTVRETPQRLDSIAAMLKRYDGAPHAVMLHFQVIEAGDFAGSDSAIARVEAPLRELFRYRGYRLVGDLTVRAVEGTDFSQTQPGLQVSGAVGEVTPTGPDARVTLEVSVGTTQGSVRTSVSGAPGKTLVIGTQQSAGGKGALIAAVTPQVVEERP